MSNKAKYYQHNKATNDLNGNPRRCYCIYNKDMELLSVIDEGYKGITSIDSFTDHTLLIEMPSTNITPKEYKELLKFN